MEERQQDVHGGEGGGCRGGGQSLRSMVGDSKVVRQRMGHNKTRMPEDWQLGDGPRVVQF